MRKSSNADCVSSKARSWSIAISREKPKKAERRKVAELGAGRRERLYDISWFMRCLNESLARISAAIENIRNHPLGAHLTAQILIFQTVLIDQKTQAVNPGDLRHRMLPGFIIRHDIAQQRSQLRQWVMLIRAALIE